MVGSSLTPPPCRQAIVAFLGMLRIGSCAATSHKTTHLVLPHASKPPCAEPQNRILRDASAAGVCPFACVTTCIEYVVIDHVCDHVWHQRAQDQTHSKTRAVMVRQRRECRYSSQGSKGPFVVEVIAVKSPIEESLETKIPVSVTQRRGVQRTGPDSTRLQQWVHGNERPGVGLAAARCPWQQLRKHGARPAAHGSEVTASHRP